jgi:hypothetical protein
LVYPICTASGTPKALFAQSLNQNFSMSVSTLVANYCCISPFLAFIVIKMSLKTNNLPIF